MGVWRLLGAATAAGAAGVGYALWEAHQYTLREVIVPVLPAGSDPLRVLHISDVHMVPTQRDKVRWLQSLAEVEPDFVVNTGDNLSHMQALPTVLEAYGDLLDLPGVFVFGSNDYFSPTLKNPVKYLTGGTSKDKIGGKPWWQVRERDLPFEPMRKAFTERGPNPKADLAIGVAHAPYLRVLDRWNSLGYPLILAGHTHGGQLCLPFYGAMVTNCDLDRERAKGLHRHQVDGHAPSWMHVSGGLGTSRFAPLRFACRPEASLLTLTGIDSAGLPGSANS